jgi:hypothetical protein
LRGRKRQLECGRKRCVWCGDESEYLKGGLDAENQQWNCKVWREKL